MWANLQYSIAYGYNIAAENLPPLSPATRFHFRNPFKPNKAAYLLPCLSESIDKIKEMRFGWVSENKSPVSIEAEDSHLFQTLYLAKGGFGGTQSQAPALGKDSEPNSAGFQSDIQRKAQWRDGGKSAQMSLCLSERWTAIMFIYKISRADRGRATGTQRKQLLHIKIWAPTELEATARYLMKASFP